jgi:nocardicin N-oxygenase
VHTTEQAARLLPARPDEARAPAAPHHALAASLAAVPGSADGGTPVLTFAAEPDGGPPQVLRAGATGDYALRPSGGQPMLVLRRRGDVLRALSDTAYFGMAGVTRSGELRRCPLTGAEMQSPDGGLLNMNPPRLREYRQRITALFTRQAAQATRPAIEALAARLARALDGQDAADIRAGFAGPFTAEGVCQAMGVPLADWDQVDEYSRMAFAVVPDATAIGAVAAAWEGLYGYYEPFVAAARAGNAGPGLASQVTRALDGFTSAQIVHVLGTVSNGFGAVLPVLATALTEVARQPQTIEACLRGQRSWASVAAQLVSQRSLFPVALPREVLADIWLADRLVPAGTIVLPSLVAAANDGSGPPGNIAFGPGPHLCPGAALTQVWLTIALEVFFGTYPAARLDGALDWQVGTLSMPREIPVDLRARTHAARGGRCPYAHGSRSPAAAAHAGGVRQPGPLSPSPAVPAAPEPPASTDPASPVAMEEQ